MTTDLRKDLSPVLKARIAGFLYLIVIAGGLFAELGVRQQLIVSGAAGATAENILAHEALFRAGFAVNLFYLLCNIPFAVLFYDLFKVANRTIARVVMLAIVVTTTIEAVNLFQLLTALDYLTGTFYAGLAIAQRYELAYLSLQGFAAGFGVSLVFFGFVCLLYGWLILQSGFVPRVLGVLITLAGLCYLINSFAIFLAPDFAVSLFPFILLPSFVGELCLALWLAVMGVNAKRWEQALSSQTRSQ